MTPQRQKPEPIGQLLKKAGLISEAQVQIALMDQAEYRGMLFGEVLVKRGWIKAETLNFFLSYSLPQPMSKTEMSRTETDSALESDEDPSIWVTVRVRTKGNKRSTLPGNVRYQRSLSSSTLEEPCP